MKRYEAVIDTNVIVSGLIKENSIPNSITQDIINIIIETKFFN